MTLQLWYHNFNYDACLPVSVGRRRGGGEGGRLPWLRKKKCASRRTMDVMPLLNFYMT